MIKYGLSAAYCKLYSCQLIEALNNNFGFLQVSYFNSKIALFREYIDPIEIIRQNLVPIVLHAVLDYNLINENTYDIIDIINNIPCKDLIIHPISQKVYNENILDDFVENMKQIVLIAKANGIKTYIENNARNIYILNSAEQFKYVFSKLPDLELVLDIAHLNSLDELETLINIKYPKILHVADRNYNIEHEHLFLGEGEIDYEYIFTNHLKNFSGKLIFEAQGDISKHVYFKDMIEQYIHNGDTNERNHER